MLIFYPIIIYFQLYIDQPSIVLFNYKLNSNYINATNLLINNVGYRETSIPSNFNGITAFELNPGKYNLKMKHMDTNLDWKTFTKYQKIMTSQHNLNDIIVNNSTLVSYKYYSNNNHMLHFAYQIVLPPKDNQIEFTVNIDGITYTKISNNGFSIYKNITLYPGYHFITITSKSSTNWCSCPSIGNGYMTGRYFYAWINKQDEHDLIPSSMLSKYSINIMYIIHLLIT